MGRRNESGRIGLVVLLSLAAIVVLVLMVALPLGAASLDDDSPVQADTARITSLTAEHRLDEDGTLHVVERITTQMPGGKRGIFRYFDVSAPEDENVRLLPRDIEVERDGRTETTDISWEQGRRFKVVRIGHEDRVLSAGEHVYEIRYRIEGAISPTSAGQGEYSASWPGSGEEARSAYFWNVVPQGWGMEIDGSRTTIRLPGASGEVRCAVGQGRDAGVPCTVTGAGTEELTVSTGALPPRTPVTLRADLPTAAPERDTAPWGIELDGLLGRSPVVVGVLIVLACLFLLSGIGLVVRSREERPGFPVMYAPPDGLGPVQTYYVMNETVPSTALTATLLDLDERGLVEVREEEPEKWVVRGLRVEQHHWEAVDPISRQLAEDLGVVGGGTFRADGSIDAGERLQRANTHLTANVTKWGERESLVAKESSEQLGAVAAVISLVLAGILLALGMAFWFTLLALPFAAFALGSMGLVRAGVGTRRTPAGREVWSRAGGFHRMLSTDSAEARFDFSAYRNLYTAFIPYAVAFGVADQWAKKYETEMGEPAPVPAWYPAYGTTGHGFMGSGGGGDPLAGFQSSLSSSISAYTASQSSSSGGGGGFSGGGGGGGGGGGSW